MNTRRLLDRQRVESCSSWFSASSRNAAEATAADRCKARCVDPIWIGDSDFFSPRSFGQPIVDSQSPSEYDLDKLLGSP